MNCNKFWRARRLNWEIVINCQENHHGDIVCNTAGGDELGVFPVPQGEPPFAEWVADEVTKSRMHHLHEMLLFLDPQGSLFCTRRVGHEFVAMKKYRGDEDAVKHNRLHEIAILRQLSHRNLVGLFE